MKRIKRPLLNPTRIQMMDNFINIFYNGQPDIDSDDIEYLNIYKPKTIMDDLVRPLANQIVAEVRTTPEDTASAHFTALFSEVPSLSNVEEVLGQDSEVAENYRKAIEAVEFGNPDFFDMLVLDDNDVRVHTSTIKKLTKYLYILADPGEWRNFAETHAPQRFAAKKGSKPNATRPLDITRLSASDIRVDCSSLNNRSIQFMQRHKNDKWYQISRADFGKLTMNKVLKKAIAKCKENYAKNKNQHKNDETPKNVASPSAWVGLNDEFWLSLEPLIYARASIKTLEDPKTRAHVSRLYLKSADENVINDVVYTSFMKHLKEDYCFDHDCPAIRAQLNAMKLSEHVATKKASLKKASLKKASLKKASLKKASLKKASLKKASLKKASLKNEKVTKETSKQKPLKLSKNIDKERLLSDIRARFQHLQPQ